MTLRCKHWLLGLLLLLLLPAAQAAITCTSISSPGGSLNYVNASTTGMVQSYFTVSCTRGATTDPMSITYDVLADNGQNPSGQNNRAAYAGALVRYDLYTSATCATLWKANKAISDTITWTGNTTGTITKQTAFWLCTPTAQTVTTTGLFTDTVTMTMTYANNITRIGTIPVSIYAPASCTFTTLPADIALTYAAFGPLVTRSTPFSVTCNSGMPYTVSTDVTEGVLTGVRYLLSLSATSTNGTGVAQTHTITATIPGGQAGSCGTGTCTGTNVHTLTITY
jgi:spore coat protein U-like protein